MKRCTKCKVEKPLDQFSPSKTGRGGLFSQCRSCCVARAKAWALANPERLKAYKAEFHAVNRDANNAARRERDRADPEKVRSRVRAYKRANLDKVLTLARNGKARKRGAPGRHTKAETDALLIAQDYCCGNPYCLKDLRVAKKHLDHKTPLSRGGSNGIENLQWLCATCNLRKNAKTEEEWLGVAVEIFIESISYPPNASLRSSQRPPPSGPI